METISSLDSIKWTPHVEVHKYQPETVSRLTALLGYEPGPADLVGIEPDEIAVADGNLLTTSGLTRISNLIVGTGSTPAFTAAQGICGVGSSATAAAVGDTALGGNGNSTTAWYRLVDAQPTVAAGVISASCTFQSADGNFAWNEWCWAIATGTITPGNTLATVGTTPVMLNHKVQSLGTKASGAVWTLQATVTLS